MGVLAVLGAGRLGLGGGERDSSGGAGQRGGAIQGGGNGTGREVGPGIRVGNTKYQLNKI